MDSKAKLPKEKKEYKEILNSNVSEFDTKFLNTEENKLKYGYGYRDVPLHKKNIKK